MSINIGASDSNSAEHTPLLSWPQPAGAAGAGASGSHVSSRASKHQGYGGARTTASSASITEEGLLFVGGSVPFGGGDGLSRAVSEDDQRILKVSERPGEGSLGFGRKFWRRMRVLLKVGFGSKCSRRARWSYFICFLTILCAGGLSGAALLVGPVITAIEKRDGGLIAFYVAVAASIIVSIAIGLSWTQYQGSLLALEWRASLVSYLQNLYFRSRVGYNINSMDRGKLTDNADQRLTQDLDEFTTVAGGLIWGSVDGQFGIVYLVGSVALSIAFLSTLHSWMAPALGIAYVVAMSCGTALLTRPIVPRTYAQNVREGVLRFNHVRVKEFSEAIVLYGGQAKEGSVASTNITELYFTWRRLILANFWLRFWNFVSGVGTQPVVFLILSWIIATHDGHMGDEVVSTKNVQQFVAALSGMIGSLLGVPALLSEAGTLAGYTHRIGQIFERAAELNAKIEEYDERRRLRDGPSVQLERVSARTPLGQSLFSDLTLKLGRGQSAIIMGPSGSGKSSLLRVIAGLWPAAKGAVTRPAPSVGDMGQGSFFLPQRPYLTLGSLRDNLTYPAGRLLLSDGTSAARWSDAALEEVMRKVQLEYLLDPDYGDATGDAREAEARRANDAHAGTLAVTTTADGTASATGGGTETSVDTVGLSGAADEREGEAVANPLDRVAKWADMLSVGEMQRLSFARCLLHRPAVAIMDESTSALDEELQARCMALCKEAGIDCVSVAHRESLLQHHDVAVVLDGEGGHKVMSVPDLVEQRRVAAIEDARTREERGIGGVGDLLAPSVGTGSVGDSRGHGGGGAPPTRDDDVAVTVASALLDPGKRGSPGVATGDDDGIAPDDPTLRSSDVKFDAVFWRRLRRLIRIGFPSLWSKPAAVALMALAFNAVSAVAEVALAFFTGPIIGAMVKGTLHDAVLLTLVALAVGIALAMFQALCRWVGMILTLYWFRAIVDQAHSKYFTSAVAYLASNGPRRLDNVDQRIAEDSRLFTTSMGQVAFGNASSLSVVHTLMVIGMAAGKAIKFGWLGLTMIFGFTVLAMTLVQLLLRPVPEATFRKNQREGDFRFHHARFREFAEPIAFFRGEAREHAEAASRFAAVYAAYRRFLRALLPGFFATRSQQEVSNLLPFTAVAVVVMAYGSIQGQAVTADNIFTSAGLLTVLMGSLSQLPGYLPLLAHGAGFTHRVGQLLETLDAINDDCAAFEAARRIRHGSTIAADGVTLVTPTGSVLFKDLSFSLKPGQSLLVTGSSGVGKSSLLRLLCGLWPFHEGTVTRPVSMGRDGSFFVPQRTYIVDGCLRDQLLYPHDASQQTCTDAELLDILEDVGLAHLLGRGNGEAVGLDSEADWADELSVGEAQRLGFARVLYHRPRVVFCDESTSALDAAMEARCMGLCRDRGMTFVSVAHRASLRRFHQVQLTLLKGGGFEVAPIAEGGREGGDSGWGGGGGGGAAARGEAARR